MLFEDIVPMLGQNVIPAVKSRGESVVAQAAAYYAQAWLSFSLMMRVKKDELRHPTPPRFGS